MVMTNVVSGSFHVKKKTTQGRKKIEIKKIEEINNRQVTFSKRRAGLFKKASELCVLTGAQIAILVYSPGGRVFAFGHPTADILVDRYLNNNKNNATDDGAAKMPPPPQMREFNRHYVEVSKELETEKKRREKIQEEKKGNNSVLMWYDEPIEGLDLEELELFLSSLEELKKKVLIRAEDKMAVDKNPVYFGSNMFDIGLLDYNGNNNNNNHHSHIGAQNTEMISSISSTNANVPFRFNFGFGDQV